MREQTDRYAAVLARDTRAAEQRQRARETHERDLAAAYRGARLIYESEQWARTRALEAR